MGTTIVAVADTVVVAAVVAALVVVAVADVAVVAAAVVVAVVVAEAVVVFAVAVAVADAIVAYSFRPIGTWMDQECFPEDVIVSSSSKSHYCSEGLETDWGTHSQGKDCCWWK